MSTTTKNKRVNWIVITLIILNLVTLSFFWIDRKPHQKPPNKEKRISRHFLERRLDFTEEQRKAFRDLRKEHFKAAKEKVEGLREAKNSFYELLSQPDVDSIEYQNRLDRIDQQHSQLNEITFQHFQKVRAICDDQQKVKFDSVYLKVLDRMSPFSGGKMRKRMRHNRRGGDR
ncbi:MAG: periplasmic heavy metal sensor [Bacteroidota bacterium]